MKNILRNSLLSTAFVLGITSAGQAGAADVKSIAEQANAAWNQAFNSGNAAALSQLYQSDAILSPGNGQILEGHSAIEQLFKSFIDNGVHNHKLEIVKASGTDKLIYQVAKWSANGAAADGGEAPGFGGITTSVMELGSDGKWHIRSHVWNAATD